MIQTISYSLKLVRWPNLFMLALLQYMVRYAMAEPLLEANGKGMLLTDFEFFIMVMSCVFLTAGGNAINDIEDMKIDAINRTGKQIVGVHLSKDFAYNLYLAVTFLGVLGGLYLSYYKQLSYIGVVLLISSGLMYFYSTSYKCIPLLGNIVVAGLTAVSIFLVVIAEPLAREDESVMLMIGACMFFGFTTNLLREIIKDIEDMEGDAALGCKTLATTAGPLAGKIISIALSSVLLLLLVSVQFLSQQWETPIPFYYLVITVDMPLLGLIYLLCTATTKAHYTKASLLLKLILLAGILSLAVFYFSFLNA
jgi:4-hydroxybenzoate polyprenyltransferase